MKFILLYVNILLLTFNSFGQATITTGTPMHRSVNNVTTFGTNNTVISSSKRKIQFIFTVAELGGFFTPLPTTANIDTLWFAHGGTVTPNSANVMTNFQITMAHTTVGSTAMTTNFASNSTGTSVTCLNAATFNYTAPNGTNWIGIKLTTPFLWNGTQNICVTLQFNGFTAGGVPGFRMQTGTGFRTLDAPLATSTTGTLNNYRIVAGFSRVLCTKPNISTTPPVNSITCTSPTINLSGSSTTPNITSVWSGPGIVSGGSTLTPTVNLAGTYTLTINYASPTPSCPATQTVTVTSNLSTPNVSTTPASPITCTNTTVTLAGASTTVGATAAWTGPGITAGATTFNPIVNAAGNYTLTVTNPTNGCTANQMVAVTTNNQLPQLTVAPPSTLGCFFNSTTNIVASSTTANTTALWTGTGIVSNPAAFGITVNQTGVFTVSVTNPVNGCVRNQNVTINPLLGATAANFSFTNSTCNLNNGQIIINGLTGGLAPYNFNIGANIVQSNITTFPITVSALAPGNYPVIVTDANGCKFNTTAIVPATSFPIAITSNQSKAICDNVIDGFINITSIIGGVAPFTMTLNNNPISNTFPINLNNLNAGVYLIRGIDANNCNITKTLTINAGFQPTATFTVLSPKCNGESTANVTANTAGTGPFTYAWIPAPTSGQGLATAVGLKAGVGGVLITDSNNCKQTFSYNITEPIKLTSDILGDSIFCKGTNLNLSSLVLGGTAPYSYRWEVANNLIGTSNTNSYILNNSTDILLKVKDAKGCEATALKKFKTTFPTINFTMNPLKSCPPACLDIQSNLSFPSISWDYGDGTSSNGPKLKHCYTAGGKYDIKLTVTDNIGCKNSATYSQIADIYEKPNAGISASPTIASIENSEISFAGFSSSKIKTWQWQFNDNPIGESTLQNPKYTFLNPGKRGVTLIVVSDQGCRDTVESEVLIEYLFKYHVPTAFTPNDDIFNSIWLPKGLSVDENGFLMQIYSRWGQLLFESKELKKGWDGKVNGTIQPDGSYSYYIKLKDLNGKSHQYTGNFVLSK